MAPRACVLCARARASRVCWCRRIFTYVHIYNWYSTALFLYKTSAFCFLVLEALTRSPQSVYCATFG